MEKSLEIIYNKKYLVIVPKMSEELLNHFEYTYGNALLMKNDLDELDFFIKFINQNNFKQLIFVDFQLEYLELFDKLEEQHDIKFIFTKSLASLSDTFFYDVFKNIMKLYKKNQISSIGFLDRSLYNTLKNKYKNMHYILLDKEKKELKNNDKNYKTIGILNCQEDPKHSYYNELSAIKLLDDYMAKISNPSRICREFLKTFKIKHEVRKDVINNNEVNLYINFTNNNNLIFLESMDNGIPCILGNTSLLDNDKKLKAYLVMKSDDDVNEIAEKIQIAIKNKNEILKLYSTFRKKYEKEVQECVTDFVGKKIEKNTEEKSEKLLSVIVPVYNVENYLAKSLQSILDARIENMEILVINDGSKDNSEKIALKFQKKYPNIIRYIKQENHGLGNVRNVGLKEAKGKYIASIDSDDTININFFSDAEEYMNKNIDMVLYDWLTVTDKEKYPTAALDYIYNGKNRYTGILYTTIMPSQCNKIIKKELYDKLKINYIEDKYEDLSTNSIVLLMAESIKYINKPYYEYYIRSNSIMRSSPGYSMIDVIKKLNARFDKYKDISNIDLEKYKFNTFYWRLEQYVINPLFDLNDKELDDMIKYIEKNILDLYLNLLNSNFGKEMLDNIKNEKLKENIEMRNKMINNGELSKFIIKYKNQKEKYSLTPPIIIYGE